ncbi:hypothetical protein K461DRAFT_279120, partial [Myriangium duriaei CBS 260.36]
EVPDKIHKGEATDDEGRPLTWRGFPYFAMNWSDELEPGQICRQCPDEASFAKARRLFIRKKDIEAQLVAKRIMRLDTRMIHFIIRALEKNIDDSDRQIAPGEAAAYDQVKLDFHIPAISSMFRYNAQEIHDRVVRDELRDFTPRQRQALDEVRTFKDGVERWSFWKRRLGELAESDEDEQVKIAAKRTLEYMI